MYMIMALIIIVCLLLILSVLAQSSKGGGLANQLGSSNQVIGVKKTTDLLEKITWGLAATLVVLILSTNFFLGSSDNAPRSVNAEKAKSQGGKNIPKVNNMPKAPADNKNTPK